MVIECGHAQARTGVGQRELVVRAAWNHCSDKVVVYWSEVNLGVTCIWEVDGKPCLVLLTARSLVGMLVDGHFKGEYFEAGVGTECGGERGIDPATNTYNKTLYASVLCIAFQPIRNMICRFL